jgi:hypothetical protein
MSSTSLAFDRKHHHFVPQQFLQLSIWRATYFFFTDRKPHPTRTLYLVLTNIYWLVFKRIRVTDVSLQASCPLRQQRKISRWFAVDALLHIRRLRTTTYTTSLDCEGGQNDRTHTKSFQRSQYVSLFARSPITQIWTRLLNRVSRLAATINIFNGLAYGYKQTDHDWSINWRWLAIRIEQGIRKAQSTRI